MKPTDVIRSAMVSAVLLLLPACQKDDGDLPTVAAAPPDMFPVKVNGKYGFIDATGSLVIPPRFTDVTHWSKDGFMWVTEGETSFQDGESNLSVTNCCFIDRQGRALTSSRLYFDGDWLDPCPVLTTNASVAVGVQGSGWGWINSEGTLVVPEVCKTQGVVRCPFLWRTVPVRDVPAPVRVNDLCGYVRSDGACVVEPTYAYASLFRDGLTVVGKIGAVGVINRWGRRILEQNYERLFPVSTNLVWALKASKWGLVRTNGTYAIAPEFDDVSFDSPLNHAGPALFPVKRDGKWGLVDLAGAVVQEFQMETEPDFVATRSNGLVRCGGKWGAIGLDGRWVVKPEYERLVGDTLDEFVRGSNLVAQRNGRVGLLNSRGKTIHGPWRHEWIGAYQDGLAAVKVADGTWGLLDHRGRWVLRPTYSAITTKRGVPGYYFIKTSKRGSGVGVVNLRGEVVVPPEFKWIKYFDGPTPYFIVRGDRAGIIGGDGKVLVDVVFEDLRSSYEEKRSIPFSQELFAARKGGKWGYVDSSGKFTIPPKYDEVLPYSANTHAVSVRVHTADERSVSMHGLVGANATEILPCKYASVTPCGSRGDVYRVVEKESGKMGYYDSGGGFWLWPPTE